MKDITYCHYLDHVCGLKYCLTDKYVKVEYKQTPETFIVEEVINLNSLNYSNEDGEYILYKLVKKGIDTLYAIRIISRFFKIPESNIKYIGLKDRDSTSIQYISIKKYLINEEYNSINKLVIDSQNIKLYYIGYINRKLTKKSLIGNKFSIKIGDAVHRDVVSDIFKRIIIHGLPSYYGYQRFGTKRYNTHLIGKYIVLKDYSRAVNELLYSLYPRESIDSLLARAMNKLDRVYRLHYERRISRLLRKRKILEDIIFSLKKPILLLFIEAYLSYLFNEALNKFIETYKWVDDREICVHGPGCSDNEELYYEILSREGLTCFSLVESLRSLGLSGWKRRIMLKPANPKILIRNGELWIEFSLKMGQYATIVLRELFKENLVI